MAHTGGLKWLHLKILNMNIFHRKNIHSLLKRDDSHIFKLLTSRSSPEKKHTQTHTSICDKSFNAHEHTHKPLYVLKVWLRLRRVSEEDKEGLEKI